MNADVMRKLLFIVFFVQMGCTIPSKHLREQTAARTLCSGESIVLEGPRPQAGDGSFEWSVSCGGRSYRCQRRIEDQVPLRSCQLINETEWNPVRRDDIVQRATLVGQLERRYPAEDRCHGTQGNVYLRVEILANGIVRGVSVLRAPSESLGNEAMEQLLGATFTPAIGESGDPVDCAIAYTVRYILDDTQASDSDEE